MSLADPLVNTCGCCGLIGPVGACGCPAEGGASTRPGLPAIPYRVGTHSSFLLAMQAALDHQAALGAFTTRDAADPVIGLLDAWATVLDVVTFYQERIANEGFLRTATELKSVYQLAAEIGYVPSPGVATTTFLAFEVESGKGAPASVPIDAGVKVQSLPGPGEKPQTFETVEAITARPEWNSLRARQIDPMRMPRSGDQTVYLSGVGTGLKQGDHVLVVWKNGVAQADLRRVAAVVLDNDLQVTVATLDSKTAGSVTLPASPPTAGVYALRQSAHLFAYNTPPWLSMSQKFREEYVAAMSTSYTTATIGTYATYPTYLTYAKLATTTTAKDWPGFSITGVRTSPSIVFLDATYPKVLPGSLAVLRVPDPFARVFNVKAVDRVAAAAFTVAGDVTQLTLDPDPVANFDTRLRDTEVLLQSEMLPVAWPDSASVTGSAIVFETTVPGLAGGQRLSFSGPVDTTGPGVGEASEVVVIDQVVDSDPHHTQVTLRTALQNRYLRRRLTVCANVALATHGESKTDVLGSGDSSQQFQRFGLKESPLTFVPSARGGGAESTLDVHVNGVSWHEVPTLDGRNPRDRVFLTHISDDGKLSVEFGDGVTGARLPTGAENISAKYRVGIGLGGRVRAGQLTLLQTRPLGLKTVSNPMPATGGADPEQVADARRNAPLTVLTFGRVVSLTDFESFAAAFAGIAKARAAWLWDGHRRIAHVTVAANGGAAVDNLTLANLAGSIAAASDGRQPFRVDSFDSVTFDLSARLYRDPDYEWARVRVAAIAAIRTGFAFDARGFAAPVTESEVMAALQSLPGVLGVRLAGLNLTGATVMPNPILSALLARLENTKVKAAQLLAVNPAGIDIQEQK